MMDLPAQAADVLAQPTRARLFARLGELARPAATEELADHLDLHPNGVRVHLERLHAAGLVERERARRGRGRPRDAWSIAARAQPGGEPPSAYADLGRWLARSIASAETSDVEATGRDVGRELAPADRHRPGEERMRSVLVSLGFQPERRTDPSGRLTYRLCNCPYRDAVRESQEVVCTLHRGMTRGLLDVIDPETRLAGFVPRDPDTAGCLIELRRGIAGEAPAGARPSPARRP